MDMLSALPVCLLIDLRLCQNGTNAPSSVYFPRWFGGESKQNDGWTGARNAAKYFHRHLETRGHPTFCFLVLSKPSDDLAGRSLKDSLWGRVGDCCFITHVFKAQKKEQEEKEIYHRVKFDFLWVLSYLLVLSFWKICFKCPILLLLTCFLQNSFIDAQGPEVSWFAE